MIAPDTVTSTADLDTRTRALWSGVRQALLMFVDAIERYLDMPRTADLRRERR